MSKMILIPYEEYLELLKAQNEYNNSILNTKIEVGNVVENRTNGNRFCIKNEIQLKEVKDHIEGYTFICNRAHEDGRYDYMCNFQYCRCSE